MALEWRRISRKLLSTCKVQCLLWSHHILKKSVHKCLNANQHGFFFQISKFLSIQNSNSMPDFILIDFFNLERYCGQKFLLSYTLWLWMKIKMWYYNVKLCKVLSPHKVWKKLFEPTVTFLVFGGSFVFPFKQKIKKQISIFFSHDQ